jgi:hypothetical protein
MSVMAPVIFPVWWGVPQPACVMPLWKSALGRHQRQSSRRKQHTRRVIASSSQDSTDDLGDVVQEWRGKHFRSSEKKGTGTEVVGRKDRSSGVQEADGGLIG